MECVKRVALSAVIAMTALSGFVGAQMPTGAASHRVIFVCEHGAAKSVIATAYC